MNYLIQRTGSCCFLFSLCNARRYFGLGSPEPGNNDWEGLVDAIACRHGSAIHKELVAEKLGVTLKEIYRSDLRITIETGNPVILAVWNPESTGCSLHSTLAIQGPSNNVNLINYYWRNGPVVTTLAWQELGSILPESNNFYARAVKITR